MLLSFKIFKAYKHLPPEDGAKFLKDAREIVTKKAGMAEPGSRRKVANLVCFGTRGFKCTSARAKNENRGAWC